MRSTEEQNAAIAAAKAEISEIIRRHVGEKDNDLILRHIIGGLLNQYSHSRTELGSNALKWSVDEYVAAKLGPLAPDFLALHQHLVKSGATVEEPFDFEHCDRYGVAFANEAKWKSMAIQTQSLTYMVVLEKRYDGWATHLRVCTPTDRSFDNAHVEFDQLRFLNDFDSVYPEIGYGNKAVDYFRYKDGRDRGYLCTVQPWFDTGYRTTDTILRYLDLEHTVYDLTSHVSCLKLGETKNKENP